MGTTLENEPWTAATKTLHDVPAARPTSPARSRQAVTKARGKGFLFAVLFLYAAAVTAILARRTFERNEAAAASTSPRIMIDPVPSGAAVHAADNIRLDAERFASIIEIERPVSAAVNPTASAPLVRPSSRSRRAGISATPTSTSRPGEIAPVTPTNKTFSESATLVGTNGAPIVD